ncbi:MAG: class I SAM-dependent methyltransferase [Atopobiaceae bacterium]|nr:class I SAM-dependent methyltransferase [Atopobiaceae bacterium]
MEVDGKPGIVLPEGLGLRHDEAGLALVRGDMALRCDFAQMLPRLRQDRLAHELLVRAARVRGVEAPTALDATAGLGEDSLLLAAAGFSVTLVEHDPVIAALLRDGLERASNEPQLEGIVARMTLVEGDSVEVLAGLAVAPDVVYLDPMFPAKRKDATTKKKLQLFQMLESPCANEDQLMHAALAARPRKVVVKRPLKGPFLAGKKPSSSLTGKVVRYDVYVP